jgi:hypothetical protein
MNDLNTEKIPDPSDWYNMTDDEILKKKALKLFHMVWSGTTKYFR